MPLVNFRRRPPRSSGNPAGRPGIRPLGRWFDPKGAGTADDREHQSITHHKWRRRKKAFAVQICAYAGTLLLAVVIVQAIAVVIFGTSWTYAPLDKRCQNDSVSCGLLSGIAVPLFTIAFASAAFLFFRVSRVRKGYRRRAKKDPRRLVPTAGRILERVVGRDELCYVIMDNLRYRQTRRAFVIVGGVGAGKTAVLVQLTKLLGKAKAIPVPIMLREVQSEGDLNFRELAREKFCTSVSGSLLYDGEGERAWRQLTKDDRIVVLADGLEEALIDNDERNNIIRLAIDQANAQKLPLVIASRPHAPLRNMNAAIIELEPLSEDAAFSYLKDDSKPSSSAERLDWVIETAEVTEEPLYLQITRDLYKHKVLEHLSPGAERIALETRDADRTQLRLHLLETWIGALVEGYFPEGLAMSRDDRQTAIECIAALGCIGLKHDSVDVRYADFLGPPQQMNETQKRTSNNTRKSARQGKLGENGDHWAGIGASERRLELQELGRKTPHPVINESLAQRLGGAAPDVPVAAAWGEQLGLVDVRGSSVRFPHSILEAYLGSRIIPAALRDDSYCKEAAQKPGREFLIALVMYLCSREAKELAVKSGKDRQAGLSQWNSDVTFVLNLLKQAGQVQDVSAKMLDVYAAALEIDSANGGAQHQDIAKKLCEAWPPTSVTYDRPLEEAKLGLVRRLGEAVRKVATLSQSQKQAAGLAPHDGRPAEPVVAVPAYAQLYEIGIEERSYTVRLGVALEIGSGGEQAYLALKEDFRRVLERLDKGPKVTNKQSAEDAQKIWREDVLCAWLAPLLAGTSSAEPEGRSGGSGRSSTRRASDSSRSILSGWLSHLGGRPGVTPLPVSLEIALAQGFKYAANRQPLHKSIQPGTRAWLAEETMEMLKRSRFWFTQLTLLHALCLWALRDDTGADPEPGGHGSQPEAIVQQWLAVAGSEYGSGSQPARPAVHPFVAEVASLVILALKEQRPDRYIWIDESGVTGIVGSHAERMSGLTRRKHQLWIPASTGWSVLDPRAQRLVADVLLLLNLAERGDRPEDHDRRLSFTDRLDLPPCLTEERSFLSPGRPSGAAGAGTPGSNCKDGCHFKLCPYPPWGGPSYRVELSGPFCRSQQVMLGRKFSHARSSWQKMPKRNLKKSWGLMAERARGARRAGEGEQMN